MSGHTCVVCYERTPYPAAHWAFESLDPTMTPANQIVIGALLREAKRIGRLDEFLCVWSRKRAERLRAATLRQRDWQTRISRRPRKGRHHDSWSIRERYVRGAA